MNRIQDYPQPSSHPPNDERNHSQGADAIRRITEAKRLTVRRRTVMDEMKDVLSIQNDYKNRHKPPNNEDENTVYIGEFLRLSSYI